MHRSTESLRVSYCSVHVWNPALPIVVPQSGKHCSVNRARAVSTSGTRLAFIAVFTTACVETPNLVLPVPEHIPLSELHVQLVAGDTLRITAPATGSRGTPLELPGIWSSSDPSVAEVDSTGLLVATGRGGALVSFEASGLLGHVDVQVERQEVEWTGVASGCGVRSGELLCWEWSAGGLTPPQPPGGSAGFLQVARGPTHACAIGADHQTYCWGSNTYGQLGDGTTTDRAVPTPIVSEIFVEVAVGPGHTCGVATSGTLHCWGSDANGQLGIGGSAGLCNGVPCRTRPAWVQLPTYAVAVAAGGTSSAGATCAITNDGQVFCWGTRAHGILGDGAAVAGDDVAEPQPIAGGHRFMDIAVGGAHACAVTSERQLNCWGANASGQRGTNDGTADASTPIEVIATDGPVIQVVAGDAHTCARLWHGGVQCWGSNTTNQVSPAEGGSPGVVQLPQDLTGSRTFFDIAASDDRTCGIATTDEVVCWGGGVTLTVLPSPGGG